MPDTGRIRIDDLEGAPQTRVPDFAGVSPPKELLTPAERADWLRQRNLAAQTGFPDDDPMSARYARASIDETPGTILHYWFGQAADRPEAMNDRMSLWFGGGFELDKRIANRFSDIVAKLASGEAFRWAAQGPHERLAAVIALDQFTRNIFRGDAAAFENDRLAAALARQAIASGEDLRLKPIERWFLYMPLEHSESSTDQRRSVQKFGELYAQASPEMSEHMAVGLDYARRHAKVIGKFGRFPHRNGMLGRTSTSAEKAFLKKTPSGF